MTAGETAQFIFEVSIGVLCIVLSFTRKNDKSEGSNFIRKYNKQILLIGGIFMFFRGAEVFIENRPIESESITKENTYTYKSDQNYDLDDTNNPIFELTIPEQQK